MRRLWVPLALLSLLPVMLCAADWPRFLGPNGNGTSPETGINKDWNTRPPSLLWKIPMSDRGYAGPSVAGGKLFIIDHQGDKDIVRALDLRTGKDVWTFTYQDAPNANYGYARSTPTVDGNRIYVLGRLGQLFCLETATGRQIWARNIQKEFRGRAPSWQYGMSPYLDGDKLIVVPGGPDAAVAALNKHTGATIWQGGGSDVPGYATPVKATIMGKPQYVVFTGKNLIGVDANTGALQWSHPWKTQHDVNAATPIVDGNYIFITSNYGRGCCLLEITQQGPKVWWENKSMHSHFNSPSAMIGYIFGTTDPGFLVCINPQNGEIVWKQPGFEKGGIVIVDGTIIALNGRGGDCVMVSLTSEGYQELGRFRPLGGQSWTAPIVADGKLIVRNTRELACYDLK